MLSYPQCGTMLAPVARARSPKRSMHDRCHSTSPDISTQWVPHRAQASTTRSENLTNGPAKPATTRARRTHASMDGRSSSAAVDASSQRAFASVLRRSAASSRTASRWPRSAVRSRSTARSSSPRSRARAAARCTSRSSVSTHASTSPSMGGGGGASADENMNAVDEVEAGAGAGAGADANGLRRETSEKRGMAR